jgi:D-serine deaminase-like pyridoxal phosphate-dependent protein
MLHMQRCDPAALSAAAGAAVSVVVDAVGPLQQLAQTAHAWRTCVDVLVEVNAGQDRCAAGVSPLKCQWFLIWLAFEPQVVL